MRIVSQLRLIQEIIHRQRVAQRVACDRVLKQEHVLLDGKRRIEKRDASLRLKFQLNKNMFCSGQQAAAKRVLLSKALCSKNCKEMLKIADLWARKYALRISDGAIEAKNGQIVFRGDILIY